MGLLLQNFKMTKTLLKNKALYQVTQMICETWQIVSSVFLIHYTLMFYQDQLCTTTDKFGLK